MATKPPAARAAERAQTQPYTVVSALHHDGEPYTADDTVELTAAQAQPLLALGAVKPAAATPAA